MKFPEQLELSGQYERIMRRASMTHRKVRENFSQVDLDPA
jgi:hypothetical protein